MADFPAWARVKQVHEQGVLFEPNHLPDSLNQLLVDLCAVVVHQGSVINELVFSTAKIKNEIMQNKAEMVKMNVALTEVSGAQALVRSVAAGMKSVAEEQDRIRADVGKVGRDNQRAIQDMHVKMEQNDMELREMIRDLKGEEYRVPSTFEKCDDQPVIIDNRVTDISPLVRGCYRESRRVDVLNEELLEMKKSLDGGLKVVAECDEGVQQFQHHLHDLGWNLMQTRTLSSDRTRFLMNSIGALEDTLRGVWEMLESVGYCVSHCTSNVSGELDKIMSVVQQIYPRQMPFTISLEDSVTEVAEWTDQVKDRKAQFDEVREKFAAPPVDMTEDPIINVGKGETKGCMKVDEGAAVQQSLLQIRRKMNELAQGLTTVGSDVRSLQSQTRQKLDGKIDAKVVERMFEKLQVMIEHGPKKRTASPAQSPPSTELIRERSNGFYDRVYTEKPRVNTRRPASARRSKATVARVMSQNVRDPSLF